MKLTWFGGTTLRVYLGGEIVVVDAEGAPAGIDRGELLAGADRVVKLSDDKGLQAIDPAKWRPRAVPKMLDEAPLPVAIWRIGEGTVLVAAAGEPPLVLLGPGEPPRFGRWADGAVVVLLGASGSLVATATVLLDVSRVKLVALAADEQTLDVAIDQLSEHLDGAGLVALEPGLALEV